MTRRHLHAVPLALLAMCLLSMPAFANHRRVGFSELVHRAHVIFDGRVIDMTSWETPDGRSIKTDVTFSVIDLVHADPHAWAHIGDTITITLPGGTFGDRRINVSSAPNFVHGERVLLCAYLDVKNSISPIVGGEQGVFRIRERGPRYEPVPTKEHSFGLLAIDGEYVRVSPRIDRFEGNEAFFLAPPNIAPPARARDGNPDPVARVLRGRGELMKLAELKLAMRERLAIPYDPKSMANAPRPRPLPIPPGKELPQVGQDGTKWPLLDPLDPGYGSSRDSDDRGYIAPLCACGELEAPAVFEIQPVGSVNREIDIQAMNYWHLYLNNELFFISELEAPCGDNGDSESGLWADNEYLLNCWGSTWDEIPAIAVCISETSSGDCNEIISSDTLFNTEYHWQEFNEDRYRNSALHEIGHAWGYIAGVCAETYIYESLSAMGTYIEEEDSKGIHAMDALVIRLNYDDQISLWPVADVGCEQYIYVEGEDYRGYINDEWEQTNEVEQGDQITVYNITVENISSQPMPVTLAFFASQDEYLDEDEDIRLGTFGWDEMPAYSSTQGDYTMTIPDYIAPGEHFVFMRAYFFDFVVNDLNPDNNTISLVDSLVIINASPENDQCDNAQVVTEGTWTINNLGADSDGGVLSQCDGKFMYPMWHDVWFSYENYCAGTLELDTCFYIGFNTVIAVYEDTGVCPPDPGSLVACNDDTDCEPYRSWTVADVAANTPYLIRIGTPFHEDVGSPGGSMGDAQLNVNFWIDDLGGAPNDECNLAEQINASYLNLTTSCATTSTTPVPDEMLCTSDGRIHNDLWYRLTATCSGTARINGYSSQFDVALAVYDATTLCDSFFNALIASECATEDDNSPVVEIDVVAGMELAVRIGGLTSEDRGSGTLWVQLFEGAPNDTSVNAVHIENGNVPLDTTCASSDGVVHAECGPIENDIWFQYDSTVDGNLEIITCGLTDFDDEIAVYIDLGIHPPPNWLLSSCTNQGNLCDGGSEILTSRVLEGQSYLIRVGGSNPDERGGGIMKIRAVPGCIADVISNDGSSGRVDISDMLAIISDWGVVDSPYDVDGDRVITILDLFHVLDAWGPCPEDCADPFMCQPGQSIFDYVCGGDDETYLCACMLTTDDEPLCVDITELLTDDPAGCDQFEPCPEEGCPPGYRCVYLDCCEMSLCLPLCP